ncbi:aspartate dehydrogenase [Sneathiella glossodoripedis]|uniref:aspartate dehydrogenase n=1 Tax=Sneathiella glossodoripedis TaxID=418853 RepID=UPI000472CAE5|nr:aspartate dehydrogenase [Sneathiella glossodoripedis]
MKIGIIGDGAIGRYVSQKLTEKALTPSVRLVRPARLKAAKDCKIPQVGHVGDLPGDISLMIDCAGHSALLEHGPSILKRGISLISVSLGALADKELEQRLTVTAKEGGAQLHLATGAIGALDCLQAARVGGLSSVTYVGRKPPKGWQGSKAEETLDLSNLEEPAVHFHGSARDAAMNYPKNANVAAAVAIAGIGFDETAVQLIADPSVTANIHEINAVGEFGQFHFRIEGKALPDNPKSSALAAMSVISSIERRNSLITI